MVDPLTVMRKATGRVAEVASSVVGLRGGTEEPPYSVKDTFDGIEIRRYRYRIAAQTTVLADDRAALNTGFRRLARYIFGSNCRAAKIAMTAPVAQQPTGKDNAIAMTAPVAQTPTGDGGSMIQFFMPAEWTMDSLPEPDDESVSLVALPPETLAVLRFSGDRSPKAIAEKTAALLSALHSSGYQVAGTPIAWFYDPPFTIPFRRRNEVAVPVAPS